MDKLKTAIVTISMYVYGETMEEIEFVAKKIAKDIKDQQDNDSEVESIKMVNSNE